MATRRIAPREIPRPFASDVLDHLDDDVLLDRLLVEHHAEAAFWRPGPRPATATPPDRPAGHIFSPGSSLAWRIQEVSRSSSRSSPSWMSRERTSGWSDAFGLGLPCKPVVEDRCSRARALASVGPCLAATAARGGREDREAPGYPAPVPLSVAEVRTRYHKPIKYGMVSAVAVVTGQTTLILCLAVLEMEPVWANVTSVMVGTIPSYLLNRAWVWGKRGSHHFWREVAPFWFIALLGLGFSTLLVHLAAQWSDATLVLAAANLSAFGILWVAKYLFLDYVLFKVEDILDPDDEDEGAITA